MRTNHSTFWTPNLRDALRYGWRSRNIYACPNVLTDKEQARANPGIGHGWVKPVAPPKDGTRPKGLPQRKTY